MPWNMFITAKDVSFHRNVLVVVTFYSLVFFSLVLCRLQAGRGLHWSERFSLCCQFSAISRLRIPSSQRYIQLAEHFYSDWVRHSFSWNFNRMENII